LESPLRDAFSTIMSATVNPVTRSENVNSTVAVSPIANAVSEMLIPTTVGGAACAAVGAAKASTTTSAPVAATILLRMAVPWFFPPARRCGAPTGILPTSGPRQGEFSNRLSQPVHQRQRARYTAFSVGYPKPLGEDDNAACSKEGDGVCRDSRDRGILIPIHGGTRHRSAELWQWGNTHQRKRLRTQAHHGGCQHLHPPGEHEPAGDAARRWWRHRFTDWWLWRWWRRGEVGRL